MASLVGVLQPRGVQAQGLSAALDGDVPSNGDMSSSVVLLVMALTWFNEAFQLRFEPLEIVRSRGHSPSQPVRR